MNKPRQEEIAAWIVEGGIGTKITAKDVAFHIYGGLDSQKRKKASEKLLEVFKNWNQITDSNTLLVRHAEYPGEIVYELLADNEKNRQMMEEGIIGKAKKDAKRSQGSRRTNFAAAKNAGIEITPNIDTIVQQIRLVIKSNNAIDKLRLVGAVSPQLLELAGMSHTNESQLALAESSKEHSNA